MPSILFLDTEDADRPLVERQFPGVRFAEGRLKGDALIAACRDSEVISTFITTAFPRDIITKLPALKLLCTRSVGYDHIDLAACTEQGITVCNVPDYGSHVIAEHVFALLLSTLRHIPEGDARVHGGVFDYHGLRGLAMKGKTIGILGTGRIGRTVARIAHGFDMRILATDRCRTIELETQYGARYVPFEQLLRDSDILTLHIPGSKETGHIINADAFAMMKQGVVLVNTARGALIDSGALLDALQSGKVAYALLDVLEHEQNFEHHNGLLKHPRVVTTPHIAFYADDSMKNMYLDCFQSIAQWQAGDTPDHAVKPLQVVCDLPIVKGKA